MTRPARFWPLATLILLPVLYVLGSGPAAWLESHVPLPFSLLRTVYAPLGFVAELSEPIGNALDWYMLLWL